MLIVKEVKSAYAPTTESCEHSSCVGHSVINLTDCDPVKLHILLTESYKLDVLNQYSLLFRFFNVRKEAKSNTTILVLEEKKGWRWVITNLSLQATFQYTLMPAAALRPVLCGHTGVNELYYIFHYIFVPFTCPK